MRKKSKNWFFGVGAFVFGVGLLWLSGFLPLLLDSATLGTLNLGGVFGQVLSGEIFTPEGFEEVETKSNEEFLMLWEFDGARYKKAISSWVSTKTEEFAPNSNIAIKFVLGQPQLYYWSQSSFITAKGDYCRRILYHSAFNGFRAVLYIDDVIDYETQVGIWDYANICANMPAKHRQSVFKVSGEKYVGYHNYKIMVYPRYGDSDVPAPENVSEGMMQVVGQFYKEPDECTIPPGYSLVTEDFSAGTTITQASLQRTPVAFCNSYPIWKLDGSSNTLIEKSVDELQLLRNNSYFTVPGMEAWRVYYVAEAEEDRLKACEPDQLYDLSEEECVSLPSFDYYCGEGTYNPEEHACMVQAVSRCIEGSYNETTGQCEKLIPQDQTEFICPEGSELVETGTGVRKCVFMPTAECEKGAQALDEFGKIVCKYFPDTIQVKGEELYVDFGEIPEELHVRAFSCPTPDRFTFTETFAAGKEVNRYSFRYPVNFFCEKFPVIVTDAVSNEVFRKQDVYRRIALGETLRIPEGQTWTFIYIGFPNQQLPLVCDSGTFNVDTSECTVNPGIVHLCSEGQFDPSIGACVIQPESRALCESGRFDVSLGQCVWNPPVQAVCEKGLYNVDSQQCEWTPATVADCEQGGYDSERNKCVLEPATIVLCQRGYYDDQEDVCVYTPQEEMVCSEPYSLEELNREQKCVFRPSVEEICSRGTYNNLTNVCEWFPDVKEVCPSDAVWNGQTEKCERRASVVCEIGVWNGLTERCEYYGEVEHLCEEGSYDSSSGKCIAKPPVHYSCSVGEYNVETKRCEFVPETAFVCGEGIYDEVSGKCEFVPDEFIVCERGNYDEALGKCKVSPEVKIVCDEGSYDSSSGKCLVKEKEVYCKEGSYDGLKGTCVIVPQSEIVCDSGYSYNPAAGTCQYKPGISASCPDGTKWNKQTDTCDYVPEKRIICNQPFSFNPSTNECEWVPEERIVCDTPYKYNSVKGRCEWEPETAADCPTGTTYDSSVGKCTYVPETTADCPDNTEFEPVSGKCVYEPDTSVQCPDDAKYEEGEGCVIVPKTKILCAEGNWNSVEKACVKAGEVKLVCERGELVNGKCVVEAIEVIDFNGFSPVLQLLGFALAGVGVVVLKGWWRVF